MTEFKKVTKEEFEAWVAAYPRELSPLAWTSADATAYHDRRGGEYAPANIVAVRHWGQFGNPDTYRVMTEPPIVS